MSFPRAFQVTATLGLTIVRQEFSSLHSAQSWRAQVERRGWKTTDPTPIDGADNVVDLERRRERKGETL